MSEKMNPASKPQTKRMLNAGIARAGNPAYPDHKPSDKLSRQSAGAKRHGDNRYPDYPDVTTSNSRESTGHDASGSRKGTR